MIEMRRIPKVPTRFIPDTTLHGRTSFEWFEGGAFVIMHSEIDEPGVPTGVAIVGSDDTAKQYFMPSAKARSAAKVKDGTRIKLRIACRRS